MVERAVEPEILIEKHPEAILILLAQGLLFLEPVEPDPVKVLVLGQISEKVRKFASWLRSMARRPCPSRAPVLR